MSDKYRQVGLRSGATEQVVNLQDSKILRVGNSITLRDSDDPERWWKIVWVSDYTRPRSHLNRKWDNDI